MIGSLPWIVTIVRFDIYTAVMTMSGFHSAPRIGHLERPQRMYGYLSNMRFTSIRVRTEEPDFSNVPDHQWTYTVYGNTKEALLKDAPVTLWGCQPYARCHDWKISCRDSPSYQ
jgi:hypothetical protein